MNEVKEECVTSDEEGDLVVEGGNEEEEGQVDLLQYEQCLMLDTMDDDVLFVCGRGMGMERLFVNHLVLYSDQKLLVFVLNTSPQDESFLLSKLCSLTKGTRSTQAKIINAEVSTRDREAIYLEGGVQFITSRILIVDLLCGRVPYECVAGMLVYRAHQVLTSFQESFILRMFREKKRDGFVKAFSDMPTTMSSLGELQRLVSRLYIKRVCLVPRFDSSVKSTLEKSPVTVVEMSVDLPPLLRRCHMAMVELIKICSRELKSTVSGQKRNGGEEVDEESITGVAYLPSILEKQLIERRTFATDKQKRLLNDLSQLRDLLKTSENIDAYTLLTKLTAIRTENEKGEDCPTWLVSSLASRLFTDIQTVAGCSASKGTSTFSPPPKWKVLLNILDEIKKSSIAELNLRGANGACVMILTSDDILARQLADLVKNGHCKMCEQVSRQVIGRSKSTDLPPSPIWNIDRVITYVRNPEDHTELVKTVQNEQKTAARATKKRRQVAEGMMSSSSGVQTKIVQFGILHHKKRQRTTVTEEPSTSTVIEEDKSVVDDEIEEVKPNSIGDANVQLVITPYTQRYNLIRQLESLLPSFIILYNMDMVTLRQIELFHAIHSHLPLKLYAMQYHNSTEEDRYLSMLARERSAFDSLTRELQTLLVPRVYDVTRQPPPATKLAISSRVGGGQLPIENEEESRPKIIVDMREFSSELPTVLYKKGFDVVAATLEVGDYVLSPDVVVERKALDDLAQSLQGGRVFKQTEQMLRHYANIVLLVESNVKFETRIVNGGPFQGELSRRCRELRMQLALLIRQFPRLRLIWSPDPSSSADFFTELKMNREEPDLANAISLHGDDVVEAASKEATGSTKNNKEKKINSVLFRVLSESLPFLRAGDVKKLMLSDKFHCMRDIMRADRESLGTVVGEKSAERIVALTNLQFSTVD